MLQLAKERPASQTVGHKGLLEMMDRNIRFVTVTGCSGVGKTETVRRIREREPRFLQMPSVTTRSPRRTDPPGNYIHVSEDEFEYMHKIDQAFLWAKPIHGHWYGTRKDDIYKALDAKIPTFLDIVHESVMDLHREICPRFPHAIRSFFIYVTSREILERRLRNRPDPDMTEEIFQGRIQDCLDWTPKAKASGLYTMVDNTGHLDQTVGVITNDLQFPHHLAGHNVH